MKELDKVYDPKVAEPEIYKMWEEGGYFAPENNLEGKPFTIVMPPPNITGKLHIGHAFDNTLQDILIRYKRMRGYAALWVPGEDHASIATEVKVVEKIANEEHLTKKDIGREEFLKRAWEWSDFYRASIRDQLRKMGCSCDWNRERFTMDEGCSKAVKETFVRLHEKGYIFRANRIINWCPDCKTALSDAEVEYVEKKDGHLWYIRYPLKDAQDAVKDSIVIATTRPETMLADTGVAVNPNDERYRDFVGKTAVLPLMNREIPIIADDYVDSEYGTGAVKMTPCHDPNDFEVGKRHNLAQIRVLDDDAVVNEHGGQYQGLDRYAARKAVVSDLEELGLLVKTSDIVHNVGTCYRCHKEVEPIISLQWFVKMSEMARPAIDVVERGEVKFVPDRFKKIYFNWMENIRDWCISRQLWWGHRIPAYYCNECGEVIVAAREPGECPKCSSKSIRQDEDVLDTWFSSALWPFSTLGWPEKTADLEKFYPNDVLVTGLDIIFFWVARMIFSGIEQTGIHPFHHVYIHGLVRDELGRKMSKSLNNGVDPLDIIDEYGADAMRITLITGNAAGNDTRWYKEKVTANRNFCNKLNNAARFILMNLGDYDKSTTHEDVSPVNVDKWVTTRINELIEDATANIEKYEFGLALEKIHSFVWEEFCDWYIEFVKPRLSGGDITAKRTAQYTLYNSFTSLLKLLHPFMPFITESIYSAFDEDKPLIISEWPSPDRQKSSVSDKEAIVEIIDGIRGLRNARANMNIPPSKKAPLYIEPKEGFTPVFEGNEPIFIKLAMAGSVELTFDGVDENSALLVVTNGAKYAVPMSDLIDREKELQRLEKEKQKIDKELSRLREKLATAAFLEKAPVALVEQEREKLGKNESLLEEIEASIARFS